MNQFDFRHKNFIQNGILMYNLAKKLFPICRSITGKGFRTSLKILNYELIKNFIQPNKLQQLAWGGDLRFIPLKVEQKYMIGLFHLNGISKMLS